MSAPSLCGILWSFRLCRLFLDSMVSNELSKSIIQSDRYLIHRLWSKKLGKAMNRKQSLATEKKIEPCRFKKVNFLGLSDAFISGISGTRR